MSTGDWFEDASFDEALAHFDAQHAHATSGPIPGNGRLVVASDLTSGCGTVIRPELQRPVLRFVAAVPTRA